MYYNKYTLFKRTLCRLQDALPAIDRVKRLIFSLRLRGFDKRMLAFGREVETSLKETGRSPLFRHVEIETFNRCNGECGFCPVNRHSDPRTPVKMSRDLFESIIGQLAELKYSGSLCLYSNNESLLDDRLESFAEFARRALPDACILHSTNGLLLTPERYKALIEHVDKLFVNNYCDDFRLTERHKEILELSRTRPDWWKKTQITMRYSREILTSRGGQAPNRRSRPLYASRRGCSNPAKQFIIRPDGKVSLCCNDALGKHTLGDLGTQSVSDAWWGKTFEEVRKAILQSRENFPFCKQCDTYSE